MSISRRAALTRIIAAGGMLAVDACRPPAAHANGLHVGRAAPPATLVQLDGTRMSTQDLLGRVVILTFWATWCVPCREELPLLSDYASRHASQGLTVLGFSLDSADRLAQVARIAQSLSFSVGLLERSSVPGYGRIWKIPVNFTIDRAGLLVDDGWKDKVPTWTPDRLERIVTPLLKNNT